MSRLALLTLLLPVAPCLAQTPFDEWASTHQIMGHSIALQQGDDPIQLWTGGWRNWEDQLPVEPSTVFRVASVSKSVTALGAMRLWSEGLLDLDAEVGTLLEGVQPHGIVHPAHPDQAVTVRHLLTHTSGLRDGSGYSDFLASTYEGTTIPPISALLSPDGNAYTPDMWSSDVPGTTFGYANVNYGLLATAMEAVSGMRFDELMTQWVIEPLGLNASFNILDINDINDVAVLYRYINGWVPQADNYGGEWPPFVDLEGYTPGTNGLRFGPQGGLRCNAEDLLRLAREWSAPLDGPEELLPNPAVDTMRTVQWAYNGTNGNNYGGLFELWGLGLHIDGFPPLPGSLMWGHPGEAYGLLSGTYHVQTPDGCDFRFVYLLNGMQASPELGLNGWYTVENDLHDLFGNWAQTACNVSHVQGPFEAARPTAWILQPGTNLPEALTVDTMRWMDLQGNVVTQTQPGKGVVPDLPAGRYFVMAHGEHATQVVIQR